MVELTDCAVLRANSIRGAGAMVKLILGFVALVALSGCVAAPASKDVATKPFSLDEIYYAMVQADVTETDLSGRQTRQDSLELKVEVELTYAIVGALLNGEIEARGRCNLLTHAPELKLADRVLPTAYAHGGPTESAPLGGARPLEDWTLGPVWMEWEDVGENALVLVVFHRANLKTLGHQVAQMSLGAAFLVPTWPDGGAQETYAALAEPETGNLVWVERFDHKLDGGTRNLDAFARDLVEALKAASQ